MFRGVLVLGVFTVVAISFALKNSELAYLTSMNVFFLSFAIDYWLLTNQEKTGLIQGQARYKLEDYGLTETELHVAHLFLQGFDVQGVADKLGKSTDSIYTHSKHIRRKTNTVDRTDLVIKFGSYHENKGL